MTTGTGPRALLHRTVTTVLLALAVLFGAPALNAVLATEAPASALASCATDLPTQIAAWKAAGEQYNSEVSAINAAGGGTAAQVASYNARRAQLQSQGAALIAQVQACVASGQRNVPQVPTIPGLTPGGTPGQPNSTPDAPRGPPTRTAPTRPTTPATPAQTPNTPAPAQPAPARPAPQDKPVAPAKPTAPTKPEKPATPPTPAEANPAPAPARPAPPVAKAKEQAPAAAPTPAQPAPKTNPAQPSAPAPKAPAAKPTPAKPSTDAPAAEPVDYGSTPQERLNNPEFVKRFYKAPSPDGTLQRKDQYATDDFGNPIPKATIGPDGNPILIEDRIDTYATLGPREQAPANDNARSAIDPIAAQRTEAIAARKALQATADQEEAEQGTVTPATAAELAKAHTQVRDLSEKFGEDVARDRIHQTYPDSEYTVEELTDPTTRSGPGEADQFYLITPKNGGPKDAVLVEAKGVNADLGSKIVDGKRVQQGTREYAEDLAKNEPSAEVSEAIDKALQTGTLTYVVIRPTVDSSGRWTGSIVQQFTINP